MTALDIKQMAAMLRGKPKKLQQTRTEQKACNRADEIHIHLRFLPKLNYNSYNYLFLVFGLLRGESCRSVSSS